MNDRVVVACYRVYDLILIIISVYLINRASDIRSFKTTHLIDSAYSRIQLVASFVDLQDHMKD